MPIDLDLMALMFKLNRYSQDVPPYQKSSLYVKAFKSYGSNRQTDTQMDRQTHIQYARCQLKTFILMVKP